MKRTQLKRRTPLKAKKGLSRRSPPKKTPKPLKKIGRRGRRLQKGDRIEEKISHKLPCVCGCNAGPGEVARAHLEGRAIESTRNEEWNNPPGCLWLNRWLDQTPEGVQAKKSLWATAICLGRRLEEEDVKPILRLYGYYKWRAKADGRGALAVEV